MTISARTMLTTAVRRLTSSAGYALSATEATDFLPVLNSMLESWSLERLMVYQILQENFTLVAGTAAYTMGSGGDFNTTRPIKIVQAFTRDTGNLDFPIPKILGYSAYDSIILKSVGNTYPQYLFNDYANPLSTIRLYPRPIAGLNLYLDSWKQLQSFAIDDALALPPGYQSAIEWNLCIELADEYGRDPTANMRRNATNYKATVKRINQPMTTLMVDPGLTRVRANNILTGP